MSVLPIITLGDPRLRLKGEPVDSFGKYLHELLDDLTDTMRHAPGVGLAAPQLGVPLQACVIEVSGKLHELVNPRIVKAEGEVTFGRDVVVRGTVRVEGPKEIPDGEVLEG